MSKLIVAMSQAVAGPEAARSAAPAPDGLLHQNNNNSTKRASKRRKHYKLQEVTVEGQGVSGTDGEGRTWVQHPAIADGEKMFCLDRLSSGEAKSACVLRGQIGDFFRYFGREFCAFFTLTDESCRHPTEFNHCFDSWKTHHGSWIKGYIRVLQPQRRGAPHYHLLVAVSWNMHPDNFNWEAFFKAQQAFKDKDWATFRACRAQYAASVPPETREIWKLCRRTMPRYHIGRAEFLPIRKDEAAVSEYIGKYLEGGFHIRLHAWKGCRRIERDRRTAKLWNRHHREFAWVSPGAANWRKRLSELAAVLKVADYGEFGKKYGPRWAYRLRERITLASDEQWAQALAHLRKFPHRRHAYCAKTVASTLKVGSNRALD